MIQGKRATFYAGAAVLFESSSLDSLRPTTNDLELDIAEQRLERSWVDVKIGTILD